MHKEIKEAQKWLAEGSMNDTQSLLWEACDHIRNLLALFDRMQQEPVVEIGLVEGDLHNTEPVVFNYGKIPDFKDGRYRRELGGVLRQ